jgi:redox-sensitive bicupin YhaK (pirin superfamily)
MTAGKVRAITVAKELGAEVLNDALQGCVHGEMFPLVRDKAPNTLKLFQVWVAPSCCSCSPRCKLTLPAYMDEPRQGGQVR